MRKFHCIIFYPFFVHIIQFVIIRNYPLILSDLSVKIPCLFRQGMNDLFGLRTFRQQGSFLNSRELCEEALVSLKCIAGLYFCIACNVSFQ